MDPVNAADQAREMAAADYESAAAELERAAQHLRVTARHFRDGDVPRGCAHTLAALGHIETADRQLKGLAVLHASKARV